MVSTNTKLVCSVIGGIFFNFIYHSILMLQSLTPYILSYHNGKTQTSSLSLSWGYLFLPVFELTLFCCSPLSVLVESKLKCHL